MLESQQLGASAFAIARSGLGKAIAFKNGQASKLPIHSREIFKEAIARSVKKRCCQADRLLG
jgi:hypothetical protein